MKTLEDCKPVSLWIASPEVSPRGTPEIVSMDRRAWYILLLEFAAHVSPFVLGVVGAVLAFDGPPDKYKLVITAGLVGLGILGSLATIAFNRVSRRELTGQDSYCWFEADLGQLAQSTSGTRANQLFINAHQFVPNPNCYACEAETGGDYHHSRYYYDKKHRHHERAIVRPGRFKSDIIVIPGPYIIQITTQFAQYEQDFRFGWWRGRPFQVWELYKCVDRTRRPLKKSDRPEDFREDDLEFET